MLTAVATGGIMLIVGGLLLASINMISQVLLLIIESLLNLLVGAVHSLLMFFVKETMSMFKISVDIFSDPIMGELISTYGSALRALGLSILVLIASWQIFKGFFSFMLGNEGEEAWKIGLKCILFGFLVLESEEICRLVLRLFDAFMAGFDIDTALKMDRILDSVNANMAFAESLSQDTSFMGVLTDMLRIVFSTQALTQIINIIILLIQAGFLLLFDIKLIGIAIDLSEKYIKAVILIIVSPLSIACGVAKATSQIFSAWVKSFSGLLASVAMKYVLLALFTYTVNKGIFSANTLSETIKSSIIMIGIASLIKQSDSLVNELGFSAGAATKGASGVLGAPLMKGINIANSYGQAKLASGNNQSGGSSGGSGAQIG